MPFNSIFAWMMKKRIHQIELFRKYPAEVQWELFDKILEKGKLTKYGDKFDFQSVNNYDEFKIMT